MEEAQERVANFVRRHDLETAVEYRLLDLASEVGELVKEALKSSSYGAEQFKKTTGWENELGDVFFSLLCLANTTGVCLEEALHRVLEKYEARIINCGNAGSENKVDANKVRFANG